MIEGGLAILASRGIEYSKDALVGAMMEAEFQSYVIAFIKGWVQANSKTPKKPRR